MTFLWKVFQSYRETASGTQGEVVNNKTAEWSIKRRSLSYGFYVVRFFTQVTGYLNVTSSDFGFLNITKTLLEARIAGGSRLVRGFNKLHTFDASLSRDPDVESSDKTGLSFAWFCRKLQESWPEGDLLTLPSVSSLTNGNNAGGCFGTGIGRLSAKSNLTINTGNMIENQEYVFKVLVMKDYRRSDAEQVIRVVLGDPPVIVIR